LRIAFGRLAALSLLAGLFREESESDRGHIIDGHYVAGDGMVLRNVNARQFQV
jgi:hypothetical protein